MAPEVRAVYNGSSNFYIPEKVDSFDFGICLFTMMFKKMPFAKATKNDAYYDLVMKRDFEGFFGRHGAEGKPLNGLQLIWDCLHPNPVMRPNMRQIKYYSWVKNAPAELD